jgi:hypothetical protein
MMSKTTHITHRASSCDLPNVLASVPGGEMDQMDGDEDGMLAGKSSINRGFHGEIICKWAIYLSIYAQSIYLIYLSIYLCTIYLSIYLYREREIPSKLLNDQMV